MLNAFRKKTRIENFSRHERLRYFRESKVLSLNFGWLVAEEFMRDNYPVFEVCRISLTGKFVASNEEEKAKQPLKRKVSITSLGPFSKVVNIYIYIHTRT